ncbi:MAG: hypothetical protein M3Q03_21070, partial [Chloroflexota bacterium]|nr:hypothetical protein [Chloroflexota bacterium]
LSGHRRSVPLRTGSDAYRPPWGAIHPQRTPIFAGPAFGGQVMKILEDIAARDGTDPESDHIDADEALCGLLISMGYDDVVAVFESIRKWYS